MLLASSSHEGPAEIKIFRCSRESLFVATAAQQKSNELWLDSVTSGLGTNPTGGTNKHTSCTDVPHADS
eukprot:8477339-Karenia_brevis.AAC.1